MLPHQPPDQFAAAPGRPSIHNLAINSHSERYPAVPVMCRERDCAGTLATASASTTGIRFGERLHKTGKYGTSKHCKQFSSE